ncbi:MAG: DUF5117 domain-containing protein [Gemmatimonadales bacterium]|nr:MAG: DUF5117 domain-containing protein [Gemmatimonadales bacterium]
MRRSTSAFLPLLLALALLALPGCRALGGGSGSEAPTPSAEADPEAEVATDDRFQELTAEAEHLPGFMDLYRTDDQLLMAVPEGMLGREFLMEYKLARGLGTGGLYGGTMLSIFEAEVVTLERRGERLYLMKQPHRFRAREGTPQAAAVELSFTPSIMETAGIEATRDAEGHDDLEEDLHLVDVTGWFVGDISGMSQRLRSLTSTGQGPGPAPNFDGSRSYLDEVKAFPLNLNIRTVLTYRAPQPVGANAIPDGRFLTVSVHHTLAALPEEPMEPRLADDRVGYFITAHKDFTEGEDTYFVRYVNRWRLEPGEPAGDGLVYPAEPIVYYLDRTIPEEFLDAFREGIEAWQPAFEEAGFRDAIQAEMLPEDADPDDIRFPTLRWNTSDQPGYSAIGPSVVDPRTGEILDANQLYEANMILGFRSGWRNLVEPGTAFELSLGLLDGDAELGLKALQNHTHMAGIFSDQGLMLRALLASRGELAPSDPLPEEYVHEAVRWVVMHEVGHTLGLRHNFRSSMDTPLDRLHDREWARDRGLVSSVMDYHAPNIAHDGEEQGYFYSPGVGTADIWKIAYGYTADPEEARELARLAETEGRTYGTDEDSSGAGAMDPTVNIYDLSDDPLAWGMERTEMIAGLLEQLPETVLEDNARYADLTSAFQSLLGQYSQAMAPAVKYIGGEMVYRTRPGDPADVGPFVPVERDRQLEALEFLARSAFSEEAFALSPEVLAQMGPDRWSHWGFTNTYSGRVDFPFHERIIGLQTTLLGQLFQPLRLARIRDGELRYGSDRVLTIPELMDVVTSTVWAEVWEGSPRAINSLRRELQRVHLEQVTGLVLDPPARMPSDARSVARHQLRELNRQLESAISAGSGLDAYTRAHLEDARDQVARALDAGL